MKGYGDLVTIGTLTQMAGVSVRTLQYYDEKNLLKPIISDGGRRHYDRDAILRLEQILFLKSLGFSLEEIGKKILPLKDARALNEVLIIQREMILDEIKRLNKIVTLLDPAIAENLTSQKNVRFFFIIK